jgi:sugar phosphate isomerase/epimerase
MIKEFFVYIGEANLLKEQFIKRFFIVCILVLSINLNASEQGMPVDSHPTIDSNESWHLGMQLYSFNKYTFFEALEKASALGVYWIEAYPGQKLLKNEELKFDPSLPEIYRQDVKQALKEKGLTLFSYGVIGLPNNEAECRKVFDFAKDMGIKTLTSEPPDAAWDLIDRLCQEYDINVAIHNHPDPSHYWNPDKVLEVSKGRSDYIGACADIGHWMRSGIDPVEAVKKLKGRIKSFHFGDLNKFADKRAHDVPWGIGVADIKAIMDEMYRQKFSGPVLIEYEHNWYTSVPEIRESILHFNHLASKYGNDLWNDLLLNDLSNCIFKPGSWEVTDGVLFAIRGGDLWTKERYGNFILDLQFKLDEGTNSGVFIRTGDIEKWLHTAIEVQIFDSFGNTKVNSHDCGAVFDCFAPTKNMVKKPGMWNRFTITCKDNKIYVLLNGEQVLDMDLDKWTEGGKNPDGTKNKFNNAYKDMPRRGRIGLQYHGQPIWFRNLKIRTLDI